MTVFPDARHEPNWNLTVEGGREDVATLDLRLVVRCADDESDSGRVLFDGHAFRKTWKGVRS